MVQVIITYLVLVSPAVAAAGIDTAEDTGAITYGEPKQVATLRNVRIDESSGIACSRRNEGIFWTHNDSGDESRLYAFNERGDSVAEITVAGAEFIDCEDLCSFTLPETDGPVPLLLAADTGNNSRRRKSSILYLIPEPELKPATRTIRDTVVPRSVVAFSFPDKPRDCESVAVDTAGKQIMLVSKTYANPAVYALPLPEPGKTTCRAIKKIAALKMVLPTAMDISPDGRRAVILTYFRAYLYTRPEHRSWADAFSGTPRTLSMPARKQGESICYGPDGKTLYLTSEKTPTPLWMIPPR